MLRHVRANNIAPLFYKLKKVKDWIMRGGGRPVLRAWGTVIEDIRYFFEHILIIPFFSVFAFLRALLLYSIRYGRFRVAAQAFDPA